MSLILAAIKSGTDPVAPLPPGAFHRTLEEPILCPKCHVSYNVVVDYDRSVNKFFEEDSRRHLTILRRAVFAGHNTDHRISHFETNGVIVISHQVEKPTPLEAVEPLSKLVN